MEVTVRTADTHHQDDTSNHQMDLTKWCSRPSLSDQSFPSPKRQVMIIPVDYCRRRHAKCGNPHTTAHRVAACSLAKCDHTTTGSAEHDTTETNHWCVAHRRNSTNAAYYDAGVVDNAGEGRDGGSSKEHTEDGGGV